MSRPSAAIRLVETITIVDSEHTDRKTSLMLDGSALLGSARKHRIRLGLDGDVPTLPVVMATPEKQLQLDMDAQGVAGPLPIFSSEQDAHAAHALLLQILEQSGVRTNELSGALVREIFEMAASENSIERLLAITNETIASRTGGEKTQLEWARLLQIDPFFNALIDLSQRYLLVSETPIVSPMTIVKYRRLEGRDKHGGWFRPAHLGLTALRMDLPIYGIGTARSEHTRVVLPHGIAAEWVSLERDGLPVDPNTYERVRELEHVVVYTKGFEPALYSVVLNLRPRRGDFFVPSAVAMVVSSVLLWSAWWLEDTVRRFSSHGADSDASVALLGLIPSLVMLYLLQRNEHQLVFRFYLVPRVLVLAAVLSTWFAAGAIAVDAMHANMLLALSVAAWTNTAAGVYLLVVTATIGIARSRLGVRVRRWREGRSLQKAP